jgi:ribulose-5-phosphate 4-epimerase/fuculose-1-phosphate aldolase
MIEGHGAIVTGPTIEEACTDMVRLERAAKLILLAGSRGKLRPLSSAAFQEMRTVASERPSKRGVLVQPGIPIEWRYYESLIKKGERWSRL